jgi:hypothetical protein
MTTATRSLGSVGRPSSTRKGAHAFGLCGLAARGGLYLVLAVLAVDLVVGNSRENADTRGALHDLAHRGLGPVLLVLLAIGFGGFAIWHVYVAVVSDRRRHDAARALADAGRAVVYGVLCALAISFLTTSKRSGNSDQTDRTWTARVMHWPAGRVLVGAVGVAIVAGGIYLLWRAFAGGAQDEPAVVDAAPRETPALHVLGAVGNAARGLIVALIGGFLLDAAIEYDPNRTVALDGTLKRILDATYGGMLVLLVACGFAAFGVYSVARAWVNRSQPASDG